MRLWLGCDEQGCQNPCDAQSSTSESIPHLLGLKTCAFSLCVDQQFLLRASLNSRSPRSIPKGNLLQWRLLYLMQGTVFMIMMSLMCFTDGMWTHPKCGEESSE